MSKTTALASAKNLADGGYGKSNSGNDYLYARLSQRGPSTSSISPPP